MMNKALKHQEDNTRSVGSYDEFKTVLENEGGFILANWDGSSETEESIKEETGATIRCIPLDEKEVTGPCMYSGKEAKYRVIFAKAY
jgi:prolyl-tRNA synthetase